MKHLVGDWNWLTVLTKECDRTSQKKAGMPYQWVAIYLWAREHCKWSMVCAYVRSKHGLYICRCMKTDPDTESNMCFYRQTTSKKHQRHGQFSRAWKWGFDFNFEAHLEIQVKLPQFQVFQTNKMLDYDSKRPRVGSPSPWHQNLFPPSTGKPTAKACEVWEVEQKLPAANIFSILRNLEPKFQLS